MSPKTDDLPCPINHAIMLSSGPIHHLLLKGLFQTPLYSYDKQLFCACLKENVYCLNKHDKVCQHTSVVRTVFEWLLVSSYFKYGNLVYGITLKSSVQQFLHNFAISSFINNITQTNFPICSWLINHKIVMTNLCHEDSSLCCHSSYS